MREGKATKGKGGVFRRARRAVAAGARSVVRTVDEVRAPRLRTTASLFLAGILLGFASWLLGIATLTCPTSLGGCATEREVGYLSAPNWSLTSLIIWPAMFYALCSLLRAADGAFRDIDGSPMTWLAGEGETVASTWNLNKIYLRRTAAIALTVAVGCSAAEWWDASAAHLTPVARSEAAQSGAAGAAAAAQSGSAGPVTVARSGDAGPPAAIESDAAASVAEVDWSSIKTGGSTKNALHAAFTFAAYMYQALALALMGTFAAAVILMARTVALHASGDKRPALLLDIESNDPFKRGGFERFVVVIDYIILFVFLAFINFFLTRVQNAYLRDSSSDGQPASNSIFEFIERHFVILDISDIGNLFRTGPPDYSSLAVAIGAVLVLFQCFFFFNASLRHAALQARNRADSRLVRDPLKAKAAETGLDVPAIRERLRDANVWPLGYSDLMPTLSFLTICGVTIIFYRIGIYLVFLWIAGWILARAAQGLIRPR